MRRHRPRTFGLWFSLLAVAVLVLAMPDQAASDSNGDGDDAAEVLEVPSNEPHVLHLERHSTEACYVLLAPGIDMSHMVRESRLLQISGRPERAADSPPGFRLMGLPNQHLLYQLGLRNDDILIEVNGQPFTHPQTLMRRYQGPSRPESLAFTYYRNGVSRQIVCHLFYAPVPGMEREIRLNQPRSLAEVARIHYGYEHFARLIRRANDLPIGATLEAGMWLTLPGHPALRQQAAQVGANRWVVPEGRVAEVIQRPGMLFEGLRPRQVALPEGKSAVRLDGAGPSPLYEWGLRPGDAIVRVNGRATADPLQLVRVLTERLRFRFFEVAVRRGSLDAAAEQSLVVCVLPESQPDAAALAPPPVTATPRQFGCREDARAAAELQGTTLEELGLDADAYPGERVAAAVAWKVTPAQGEFLAHHVREVLREAQARPTLVRDPDTGEPRGYSGLQFGHVDSDTLLYAYGLRSDDVLRYVGVAGVPDEDEGGEEAAAPRIEAFAPVRTSFELLAQFPLGGKWDHAILLLQRPGTGWVAARLDLIANPAGIARLGLPPAAGLPQVPGYERPAPTAPGEAAPGADNDRPQQPELPQGMDFEFHFDFGELDPREIDPELLRQLLERALEEQRNRR